MTTTKQTEKNDAQARILSLLEGQEKPRAYTILRHVSASGMSRDISVKVIDKDGDLVDISFSVAKLIGWTLRQKSYNAVRVQGCGMDMGFHLVSVLSYALYGSEGAMKQEWA